MTGDIYHNGIKQLARTAVTNNKVEYPDSSVRLDNRLCGDRIQLEICCDANVVTHIHHQVRGCLLCEAAANILAHTGVGLKTDELQQVTAQLIQLLKQGQNDPLSFDQPWQQLNLFSPVASHKSRHQCVLLPFQALQQAVDAI